MPTFANSNIVLGVLASAIKQEEKGFKIEKKRSKIHLLRDDIILL